MEELNEDGISISELILIVWKRKILISIVTVVTTIVLALFVMFLLNPSRLTYSTTFELYFPGIENNEYDSGVVFDYRDVISEGNILSVINSNSNFSNINIDEFTNNTIKISETSFVDTYTGNREFNISVSASIFETKDAAALFIESLLYFSYQTILNEISSVSYTSSLDNAFNAVTYELQISYLSSQRDYLSSYYSTLISEYGDVVVNGSNLSSYQSNFNAYFDLNSISNLNNELTNNPYVKDYESNLYYLESRYDVAKNQIVLLDKKIEELTSQRDDLLKYSDTYFPEISDYNNRIVELTISKIEYEYTLSKLSEKIYLCYDYLDISFPSKYGEVSVSSDIENSRTYFDNRVLDIQSELTKFTEEIKMLNEELYKQNVFLIIPNRDVITSSGAISIFLSLIAGAMIGCGSSCVLFIIFDLNKKEESL